MIKFEIFSLIGCLEFFKASKQNMIKKQIDWWK